MAGSDDDSDCLSVSVCVCACNATTAYAGHSEGSRRSGGVEFVTQFASVFSFVSFRIQSSRRQFFSRSAIRLQSRLLLLVTCYLLLLVVGRVSMVNESMVYVLFCDTVTCDMTWPRPRNWLTDVGIKLLLQVTSAMQRRVYAKTHSFPHRLLDLVRLPATQACTVRQQLAKELCDTPSENLECTARKFKMIHIKELTQLGSISPQNGESLVDVVSEFSD